MEQTYEFALQHTYLGFNRENFVADILEPIFHRSIRSCAEAIGIRPNYLRDLLSNPEREAGTKTLSAIYRYCIRENRDPYPYLFIVK